MDKPTKVKWSEPKNTAIVEDNYDPANSDKSVDEIVTLLKEANPEGTEVTRRMVIGKAGNLGIYAAPDRKKTGEKADDTPTKKDRLAAIRKAGFDADGLDGATKAAIARLAGLVDASADFGDVDPEFVKVPA